MTDEQRKSIQATFSAINKQMSPVARVLYPDERLGEINKSLLKIQSALCGAVNSYLRELQFSYLPLLVQLQKATESFPKDWKDIDTTQVIEQCIKEMYDNKWFPSVVSEARVSFVFEYADIDKKTTVGSKRRAKLLDQLVFSYYDRGFILYIKREWKVKASNTYQRRTLLEAIRAYERKEYATTIIVLSTFWQGLIYEKTNNVDDYRYDKETKKHAHSLLNDQFFHELYEQYFDNYIYYKCNNPNEVIEGVPGRHAILHSWYKTYPSRKEALNAILFTNTLIETPKQDKKNEEQKNNG